MHTITHLVHDYPISHTITPSRTRLLRAERTRKGRKNEKIGLTEYSVKPFFIVIVCEKPQNLMRQGRFRKVGVKNNGTLIVSELEFHYGAGYGSRTRLLALGRPHNTDIPTPHWCHGTTRMGQSQGKLCRADRRVPPRRLTIWIVAQTRPHAVLMLPESPCARQSARRWISKMAADRKNSRGSQNNP